MTSNFPSSDEIAKALGATCPYCHAPPTVPCHGKSPDTRRGPHPERMAANVGLSDPPPIDREELRHAITGIRESLETAPAHGPARSNIVRRLIIIEHKLAGGHGRISL